MYTAPQITTLVHSGQGSGSLHRGGDLTGGMSEEHLALVREMHDLQKAMEPHWQGDAAAAAYAGVNPLIEASKVAGDHLAKAKTLYEGQGSSFDDLKAKIGDGVGPKPQPQMGSPRNYGVEQTNTDEIDAWNEEARKIVDSYNVYKGQSDHNAANWPEDYGKLGLPPGGADFTVAVPNSGPADGGSPATQVPGGGYSATGGGYRGYGTGSTGSASYHPQAPPAAAYSGTPNAPAGYPGGAFTPQAPGYSQAPAVNDGSTSTSSYADPTGSGRAPTGGPGIGPGTGSGHGQGSGRPGDAYDYGRRATAGFGTTGGYGGRESGAIARGFGPRGSASYGSPASGFGPRGSSGFGPTGSGGQASAPGAGRSSAAAPAPRESVTPIRGAGAAAGPSGGSASGRGFMPGMGGAGRGQGGDETRERPTYLEENDVDSIFGPDPDDRTVPPVIGL